TFTHASRPVRMVGSSGSSVAGHQGVFGKMAISRPGRQENRPDEYDSVLTALAVREPTGVEDAEAALGVYAIFPGNVTEPVAQGSQASLQHEALIADDEQEDADEGDFRGMTLYGPSIVEPDFFGHETDEEAFGVLGKMRDDAMVIDPLDAPKSMWG